MMNNFKILDKVYKPDEIEDRLYLEWVSNGYFHGDENSKKTAYSIVIPPPNVTGMLTMGHVLNNTIQDILIRRARMEGKEVCWVPGTDHASIATETKVVNMLAEQGIEKDKLTREQFLKHAWDWQKKYGGIIFSQLQKLGCSCDWERERFTMDDGYHNAVLESFVRLYKKGLIYRGYRLVNWCPASKSAISDEEVKHREVNGSLWYFKYPVIDSDEFVIVATTRPETMLGDTAIAVNPGDKRFKHLIGKKVELPLVGREIPIITDEFVDPEFGTGCVKVTPAHDPNDFEMGNKHDLEFINIMNDDASLNDNVPVEYRGLAREDAREKVIRDMKRLSYIEKIEPYTNKVGYSERGNVPIEHYLSEQWYLKMKDLAKPAIKAVNDGTIKFHPEHWVKTYNHWMENVKDWCLSRQLWWGHRIPVYTCQDCNEIMVQVESPKQCAKCKSNKIKQDPDVLDTWASSWLWPFAVFTWPKNSKELKRFYPTEALVTGPDIIFFWVARMIIAGYEFMGTAPFKDVYFTSILRDEKGLKFSKSLGNSPDPFDLFSEYGTDAVRFGVMLMAPQGLDVLFSKNRLEVGRNFMNKLWNASRFVMMNLNDEKFLKINLKEVQLDLPEKWILSRLQKAIQDVNRHIDRFHFNEAAKTIYEFVWSDYCDWYIEIAKVRFSGKDNKSANVSRAVAVHVLKKILALLHPYAPFITEELWSYFKNADDKDLIVSEWPSIDKKWINRNTENKMSLLQELISAIRTIRSSMNVPPSRKADMIVRTNDSEAKILQKYETIIKSLCKINTVSYDEKAAKPPQSAVAVIKDLEIYIPLGGLIDFRFEEERLVKRKTELEVIFDKIKDKVNNQEFLTRAPKSVVQREREKLDEISNELKKIKINLEMMK
ncbi:MAG: valine--tRNA ligase [Candidatus Neomarinimicrobiota bacterium]